MAKKPRSGIQQFALVSDAIDQIWYDASAEVMWVKFRKVKEYPKYRFEGVPGSVVAGMINSSSAGQYYHQHLSGNYYSTTVNGPDEDETRKLDFNLLRG